MPLKLRSSRYSIFRQIQTFRTYITYRIFRQIFATLDIQFFGKSNHSVHIQCTQFPIEFSQFWIFNFSANLDVPDIYNVHNFPLTFHSSLTFNFYAYPDILYVYYVHNFPLNVRILCTYFNVFEFFCYFVGIFNYASGRNET